ncbi:MAG: hypothetical protein KAW67_09185 [Candidatus Eisenbacteria sp.]|nr:hypothetical protein [Candidatus Eisenbacteria bacterium]
MSARRILALLVVLALSLGLCSIPAGSATLQRTSITGGSTTSTLTAFKDGDDGEDIDGDDDRWGNTDPIGVNNGDPETTSGDEEDDDAGDVADMLGRLGRLRLELEILFGFLVILL